MDPVFQTLETGGEADWGTKEKSASRHLRTCAPEKLQNDEKTGKKDTETFVPHRQPWGRGDRLVLSTIKGEKYEREREKKKEDR